MGDAADELEFWEEGWHKDMKPIPIIRKLGAKQKETLGRFLGHSDDDGWFNFKRSRRSNGLWREMDGLLAKGLIEITKHDKWRDILKIRITDSGRAAYLIE